MEKVEENVMINSFLLALSLLTLALTLRTMYRMKKDGTGEDCQPATNFLLRLIIILCIMYFLLSAKWIYDGNYAKIPRIDDVAWNLLEMAAMMGALRFLSLVEACPLRKRVGEIMIEQDKIDEETLVEALWIQRQEKSQMRNMRNNKQAMN